MKSSLIEDIAEGFLVDVQHHLIENNNAITHAINCEGNWEEPDCITAFEAAEGASL